MVLQNAFKKYQFFYVSLEKYEIIKDFKRGFLKVGDILL